MGPDPLDRVSKIYHEALARPEGERTTFLREACGGDESLRLEVESLLKHDDAPSHVIGMPAVAFTAETEGSGSAISGRQIGPYTIGALVATGGMGEVYRARDSRLGRDVAIKILPRPFVADPSRRTRFEREARLLAALDHPNIAQIHGLEEAGGIQALVMEWVPGETLAATMERANLPQQRTIAIATQIANAIDAAHESGVLHRDLKPANIKIRPDGVVKVLDFGLAKAFADPSTPPNEPSDSGRGQTTEGAILGTASFMSPEQARGAPVDRRTDIWAFGCVLYEMLAGRPAFDGPTTSDVLAAIFEREPDWSLVPAATHPRLRALLKRCLVKDPKRRLRDIGDAVLDLESLESDSAAGVAAPVVAHRRSRERLAWIVVAALGWALIGLGAFTVFHLREALPDPVQFAITAPEGSTFVTSETPGEFAVSPDGRQVAFVAVSQGVEMLWVRPLATLVAHSLPGTENARLPFWSPDSRQIGFFATGKLKKVPVGGGPPIDLCVAGDGNGGTWNQDNVIVFASAESPLQKVTSAGGVPTPVTTLDKHEVSHKWPSFLPNGQHLLYVAVKRSIVESELRVAALGSSETTSLGVAASKSQYASGHLLFPRGGSLMAVSFDPQTRQRTGDPFLVAESVRGSPPTHYSPFSASLTGVLGYVRESNSPRTSRLTWMDRAGKPLGVVGDPGRYTNLSLSPDDRGVAVSMFTGSPPNRDIWLIDLARAASSRRLTFDPAAEGDPIWSPDGSQILFNSLRALPGWSFFQHAANGGGEDKLVLQADSVVLSPDWSRVGLAYSQQSSSTGFDVWILPSGSQKPLKLTSNEFDEDNPAISPDGHWLAYDSNESGKHEVYVRPLPANDRQFKISGNGGWAPRWRRDDGKELFFLALDGWMMSAGIEMSKGFQPTEPRRLFQTGLRRTIDRHTYAVTRDGKRFLFPVLEAQSSRPITIVVNWLASVQK